MQRSSQIQDSGLPRPHSLERSPSPTGSSNTEGVSEHSVGDDEPDPQVGAELTTFDIFALIVNKMIGTGIYNAPSTVLILAGSKSLAMGLWVLGLLYTVVSMVIYLEYSALLPYTGGELVYIDEITSISNADASTSLDAITAPEASPIPIPIPILYRRDTAESQRTPTAPLRSWRKLFVPLFGDGLLFYTIYSILFVTFFNSGTNSLQVGRELLAAARPQEAPNADVLRLIGVCALTSLCLLNYFSTRAGRKLNRWLAVLKIAFLIILIIAGIVKSVHSEYPGNGFKECSPYASSKLEIAKAMLLVLFSFEGWENATFVAGEVKTQNSTSLRKGFLLAVTVVGLLYIAVVAVFLYAVPYLPIAVSFAPMFFGQSRAAYQTWAVLIAISSLGSLNSIIYTFSRIKQCIGASNILPWSSLWKSDSPKEEGTGDEDLFKSPKGGLILHWIMSVALIGVSASVSSVLESVSLPGLLQTYAHCIILVILGFGFLRLPGRMKALKSTHAKGNGGWDWRLTQLTGPLWYCVAIIVIVYALVNLLVLIVVAIPPFMDIDGLLPPNWTLSNDNKTISCFTPDQADTTVTLLNPFVSTSNRYVSGWVLPIATFSAFFLGVVYFLVVFGSEYFMPRGFTVLRLAGFSANIDRQQGYNKKEELVRRFGSRRTISYKCQSNSTSNMINLEEITQRHTP